MHTKATFVIIFKHIKPNAECAPPAISDFRCVALGADDNQSELDDGPSNGSAAAAEEERSPPGSPMGWDGITSYGKLLHFNTQRGAAARPRRFNFEALWGETQRSNLLGPK